MVADDDWRIQGQARYLQGASFQWRKWSSDRPEWDHDHCEFCGVHFGDHVFGDDLDTQLEGWCSSDNSHWVCRTCFDDFRERLNLRAGSSAS